MTIQELRLGNVISALGKTETTVTYLSLEDTMVGTTDFADRPIEDFEGVPLTEEWLLKFGFEKVYESDYRIKYDLKIDYRLGYDINKALKNTPEGVSFRGDHYTNMNKVHRLQNLYFALTGEELTLNNK